MICKVYRPSRRINGRRKVARLYRGRYRLDGDQHITDVPLRVTDKQSAEATLRGMVQEQERERAGIIAPAALRKAASRRLEEHVGDFIEDVRARGRCPDYVEDLGQQLRILLAGCGWRVAADVTADSFETWRAGQREKSGKTLNEYLGTIHNLLNWMVRRGRLQANPLATVGKVKTEGREKVRRRALTDDELRRLLAVADVRRPLYLAAAETGLRRNELLSMEWGDVHLEGNTGQLRVRASTTKNSKDAVIPLKDELAAELRRIRPEGVEASAKVFVRLDKTRDIQKDLAAAGVPYFDAQGRKADFHALRHTFNTNLARRGTCDAVRMQLMRHSDPRLTAKVYTDASQLSTAAAISQLPRLLGGDSQLDSQTPDFGGRGLAPRGTQAADGASSQGLGAESERHAVSQSDTACPSDDSGSGGRARTCDQAVNSRLLYH